MGTIIDMSNQFFRGYLACALWISTDGSDQGRPIDKDFEISHFTKRALRRAWYECRLFYKYNRDAIDAGDAAQAGHDLWLTRNNHGAGFWDGDWPEPAATSLTESARAMGESHVLITSRARLEFVNG